MILATKPEVYSHSHGQDAKYLVNIARMVLKISSWTDRQTDTHTQIYSIHYFTTVPTGKIIILCKIHKGENEQVNAIISSNK